MPGSNSRPSSFSKRPRSAASTRPRSSLSTNARSSIGSYRTAASHISDAQEEGTPSSLDLLGDQIEEDDEEDHSSQDDSFDWTSSESGSPEQEEAEHRPASPRPWPIRDEIVPSDRSQLSQRTPIPLQRPWVAESSRSSPSTPQRDRQTAPPEPTEPVLPSAFVPDDAVFPTVVITPETAFAQPKGNFLSQSFTMHVDGPIVSHEEPRLHHWTPLPLTQALGIPLWFSPWAVYKNLYEYNYPIRILSIDPDFELLRQRWAAIGDGWIQPASFKGGAMLVLENGKVLKEKHVEALVTYIDVFLPEIVQFFRGGVRTLKQLGDVEEASRGKLTPLAFAEFWFKFSRRRADITGDKTWLRVECPVDESLCKDRLRTTAEGSK